MKASELFSLDGKIAVVTGALGQLGRQFTETLVDNGAKVFAVDLRVDENAVRERFPRHYESIIPLSADVTSRQSLENALQVAVKKFGIPPHILVNNAALDSPPSAPPEENGPFENYPEASWDKVIDVNLKGVFLCCQVFGGAMASEKRGSIINIASIYGVVSPDQRIYTYRAKDGVPFVKPVAYTASKSGIIAFTKYLATYWGEKNVRTNSLTFAGVFNKQDSTFLQNYTPKVPLGRMANPDEYNGIVLYLASDASSYCTGSNLIIDGGFTAW